MDDARQRRTRLLILALIFVVAVFAAFLYTSDRMADPDQFWHVATGRWIVENGQLPTTDPFSWYAEGHHWVAQSWLFGLIVYAAQAAFGWGGLYLFAAILDATLVMLVYALARARGVSALWGFLVMMVALSGLLKFAVPRPQMLTWCLVVLAALLLEKGRWPWALVCVLIGANVHGAIWPLYVALFAYYEFPRRWWTVLLAAAVSLVNPNPLGVFLYPFQAFLSPVAAQINEFAPTALWNYKWDLVMYIALVFAVHRKRIAWRDALFATAVIALTMTAIRHLQWFYVLVLPILAPYIVIQREAVERWWSEARRRPALARLSRTLLRRSVPNEGAATAPDSAAPAAPDPEPAGAFGRLGRSRLPELLLVGALTAFAVLLGARAYQTRVDVDRYYPEEAVTYLELHGIDRFFNEWRDGGYLIYRGVSPMIDGRGDPYNAQEPGGEDMAQDYMALARFERPLRDFMLDYDIEYAVLSAGPLLTSVLNDPAFTALRFTEYHAILKFDPATAKAGGAATESTGPEAPRVPPIGSTESTATARP